MAVMIGAGKAARMLGVKAADVQRVTRNSQVSVAQVQAWRADPPAWLISGRDNKRRRDEIRQRRNAARRGERAADQRLCPPAVSQLLGVQCRRVAAAMRAAGVDDPLDKATVQGWLSGASCARGMPAWLSELLATTAAEAAQQQERVEAAALEAEHRLLLLAEKVKQQLLDGKRRFGGAAADLLHEWAFDSAKELVRNDGEIDDLEAAALETVGVDPGDHTTWPVHRGGCDGYGESCQGRLAELAAQRFAEQEAARHERREQSRVAAQTLAAGAFTAGQHVLAFYDRCAAVITKVNRVTVTVKHVGGQADNYEPVVKRYPPQYLHPLPDDLAAHLTVLKAGAVVEFDDRTGRRRAGTVLVVDGPLLHVEYRLASGQSRTGWIDILCVHRTALAVEKR
ncbi:hypothetical protein PJM47_18715 [Mycobacterium kansasii]